MLNVMVVIWYVDALKLVIYLEGQPTSFLYIRHYPSCCATCLTKYQVLHNTRGDGNIEGIYACVSVENYVTDASIILMYIWGH